MNTTIQYRRSFTVTQCLILFASLLVGFAVSAPASEHTKADAPADSSAQQQVAKPEPGAPEAAIPERKHTTLGLYLTSKEAYERWKADPQNVKIIDVRTPEEYLFVGHPTMAWKIPLAVQSYEWDGEKGQYPMKVQSDFAARVNTIADPGDTIFLMCRSGDRSAIATNMLAAAGFTRVYNIYDGMEGDKVDDPASVFQGQRMVNGWKNSGCPWTYKLTPEQMVLPEGEE